MNRTLLICTVLAASVLERSWAKAGEATFAKQAELSLKLEQQNARIAALESAVQQSAPCTSCDSGCGECLADGDCDPCCRSAGYIGGVEMTWVKPHSSGGVRGARFDIDFGYDIAPRYWLGFQGSDGLGWRVRYWQFDHRETVPAGSAALTDSISYDAYLLDAELFDSRHLGCCWDATVSAGFRYVEFDQERVVFGTTNRVAVEGNQFENSSIGVTVGGELRRSMGAHAAGFISTRASVLMGDEIETQIVNGNWAPVDRELDNVYYIWEAQSGVQWSQELGCGEFFTRAAFEMQIWDNFAGTGEDWGLGGISFSAGILR